MKVTLYLKSKDKPVKITKHRLNLIKTRENSVLVEIPFDGTVEIFEVKPHFNGTYIELREEEFMSLPFPLKEFVGVLFEGCDELDSKVVL